MLAACTDRSPAVRSAVAGALSAYVENPAVQVALVRSTRDRASDVRHAALTALAPWVSDPTVLSALVDAARDPQPYIRTEALTIVRNWAGNLIVRDILVDLTKSTQTFYRRMALLALAQRVDEPLVMNVLISASRDKLSVVRQTAVEVLGAGVRNSQLRSILTAAAADKTATVRAAAIQGLGAFIDNESVLPLLLAASHDRHWPVRKAVASALAKYRCDATVCTTLGRLFEDRIGPVRECASISLARHIENADARMLLFRAISAKEDRWVSRDAYEALSRYANDPKVRIVLLSALRSSDQIRRMTIIRALAARLDEPEVVEALLQAANTDSGWLRVMAIETLIPAANRDPFLHSRVLDAILAALKKGILPDLGNRDRLLASYTNSSAVRAELIAALKGRQWFARAAAAKALATVSDDETVQAALIGACDDIYDQVRQPALSALEDLIVRKKFARTSLN